MKGQIFCSRSTVLGQGQVREGSQKKRKYLGLFPKQQTPPITPTV